MSIKSDVDRGLAIAAEMDKLKEELKEIESRLQQAGLNGPQVDLEDAEREGRQYLAHGTRRIVPVVFTADLIAKSFLKDSVVHQGIKEAFLAAAEGLPEPPHLNKFYVMKKSFHAIFAEGKQLRKVAAEVFGDRAPGFVTASLARDKNGIPKSQIKVEWDRASEAKKEGEVAA